MDKNSLSNKAFNMVNFIILFSIVIMCVYPFYYILIYSISDPIQAYKGVTIFPRGLTFDGYKQILSLDNIANSFAVSLARTVIGTGLTVVCSSFFAYLMTMENMPARKFIYRMLIITMYVSGGLIPYYLLIKYIGLRNNFLVYVIPGALQAFQVILVKTYIESIPKSLEESAMIDGAKIGKLFFYVIFPLCLPVLATICIFSAVGNWNSYFDNYFFVSDKRLQTLQIILYNYLQEAQNLANMSNDDRMSKLGSGGFQLTAESVRMTITVVVVFPVLLVYPFFQRYFVKGIMLGSVKG